MSTNTVGLALAGRQAGAVRPRVPVLHGVKSRVREPGAALGEDWGGSQMEGTDARPIVTSAENKQIQ